MIIRYISAHLRIDLTRLRVRFRHLVRHPTILRQIVATKHRNNKGHHNFKRNQGSQHSMFSLNTTTTGSTNTTQTRRPFINTDSGGITVRHQRARILSTGAVRTIRRVGSPILVTTTAIIFIRRYTSLNSQNFRTTTQLRPHRTRRPHFKFSTTISDHRSFFLTSNLQIFRRFSLTRLNPIALNTRNRSNIHNMIFISTNRSFLVQTRIRTTVGRHRTFNNTTNRHSLFNVHLRMTANPRTRIFFTLLSRPRIPVRHRSKIFVRNYTIRFSNLTRQFKIQNSRRVKRIRMIQVLIRRLTRLHPFIPKRQHQRNIIQIVNRNYVNTTLRTNDRQRTNNRSTNLFRGNSAVARNLL